jgi:hypothetical protein
MASIDRSIEKVNQNRSDKTTAEMIAALRVELHEIYKRAQQGQEKSVDATRADEIAHQIHELQSDYSWVVS